MSRICQVLVVLSVLASSTSGAVDSSRPRGVGPEFAKFYKKDTGSFACISNPAQVIPFSQVNDDYCDCPDGSDEPGTAACSYLSHLSPPQPRPGQSVLAPANESLALPGFYCKNKGHIPSYTRFENVNDGVCDYETCCDGSDEYAGVGGIKCEDRCAAIGKEYKKQADVRQQSLNKALKKRKELQFDADKRKKEVEEKIEATQIKIEGLERKVKEAEENLKETERRERLKAVKSDASGKGTGKIGVLLTLARGRVDELRKALEKTRIQRNAMVDRITELETLLSNLKEQYNPNFNDAGVKSAVQGWEDYAARETSDSWTDAEDRDLTEILKEDGTDSGINWAEFETADADETASDAAAIYSLTSYLPPFMESWISSSIANLRQILVDNGVLPSASSTSDVAESLAVQNARRANEDAQRDLTNAQNDLNRDREDLTKDYGPGGIFRALKDKCIEKDSGEYTYTHCFMSRTAQRPKRGGGETTMGNFVGFDVEYSDDDVPADGKGLGRGDRIVMKYENGQHCWNGPSRSTKVILACAEDDELWKISESEKCVYRMEVGTPAACAWENVTQDSAVLPTKDEL